MPSHDRHQCREIKIFSRFAKSCGLLIRRDSIEKRNPPEPDIRCTLTDEGPVAFEMVELIHNDFAALASDAARESSLFCRAYKGLPVVQQEALKNSCGNALVHVTFCDVPSAEKRKAIPHILSWLRARRFFFGSATPEEYPSLSKTVRKITVWRGDFNGPCFDTEAVGVFADPSLDSVQKKFTKDYDSDCPREILTDTNCIR